MKKNLIYTIISTAALLLATSCTTDETAEQVTGNGAFQLSSDKGKFTRAANTESTFSKKTAYQIYAIDATNSDFRYNYLTNPASSDAITGIESEDHQNIEGIEINKFNGKTLSFYAVTNSTEEPVEIIPNGKSAPTCYIKYKDATTPLTDVMWAKKENQSYLNSGIIKLLFGHTLAKLNLYVMKNSEYEKTTVSLNSISIKDYPDGSLNMQTGKYNLVNTDKRSQECTVYSEGNQEVTTKAAVVEKNNVVITPMLFPTRKENLQETDRTNHSTHIKVAVTIDGQSTTKEIEITSILAENTGNNPTTKEIPFEFKSNHEYDMVITITKSSLVVTIVPRLYDWIPDEELKEEDEVNGSMTISGITWMDRNLGATSGDPLAGDQAWENSRGYYYQFGRNIPYYINTAQDDNGIIYALSNGNWHLQESMPYPHVPGYMSEKPRTSNQSMARNPSDKNLYFNFCYGSNNWSSSYNWNDNKAQPCPKGWRIPTSNEFQLIIPATEKAGDIPFLKSHPSETYIEKENNDPETGSSSTYVGVKKNTWTETTVGITNSIYALKREGTDNAYFLRWHIEKSGKYKLVNKCTTSDKGDPYRNVLVISRYPATKSSTLTTGNVKYVAKWSHPVEQIKLPISGYIHIGPEHAISGNTNYPALIYSGSEAVYWTSTTNSYQAYTVRMKFAGDAASNQIMMYKNEIRNNGCLIRCVRDTKAND
ncbi:hypothetical protein [Bacteroides sp.]|uniref:hypothetical protein n=1 Tax=Bacteroides sp. TaxID=29523 RepID=UPI00260FF6D9|nr:hypothetical protein [Bacteroides sp.]MDD3038947.1 hypothetical protein [Bacteroides sp.]